jgi:hypothetical protein
MSTRFPIRVQQMRSKGQQPRFYVYVPLALAAALGIEAGEEVHWELLGREELHLVRLKPAEPLTARRAATPRSVRRQTDPRPPRSTPQTM